jgi:hypothetical protein
MHFYSSQKTFPNFQIDPVKVTAKNHVLKPSEEAAAPTKATEVKTKRIDAKVEATSDLVPEAKPEAKSEVKGDTKPKKKVNKDKAKQKKEKDKYEFHRKAPIMVYGNKIVSNVRSS